MDITNATNLAEAGTVLRFHIEKLYAIWRMVEEAGFDNEVCKQGLSLMYLEVNNLAHLIGHDSDMDSTSYHHAILALSVGSAEALSRFADNPRPPANVTDDYRPGIYL